MAPKGAAAAVRALDVAVKEQLVSVHVLLAGEELKQDVRRGIDHNSYAVFRDSVAHGLGLRLEKLSSVSLAPLPLEPIRPRRARREEAFEHPLRFLPAM
jgi:hypothetical protein